MDKIDFKKTLESYKAKHGVFQIIEIPTTQYLMIDGHGDPNTSKDFSNAISALYPIAYKLKFKSKIYLKKDYVVGPLEGLWWAKNMEVFMSGNKAEWDWTLMRMVPDWITKEMFIEAQNIVTKNGVENASNVRMEKLDEGKVVQTLHIGSFNDEAPVLANMHNKFIPENNLKMSGKHHEIYLSDFRKVEASKLKTILRQPVE